MNTSIASIRKDYTLKSLLETDVSTNPFTQFSVWWGEALASDIDEVNAMTLATIKANLKPAAKIQNKLALQYNHPNVLGVQYVLQIVF